MTKSIVTLRNFVNAPNKIDTEYGLVTLLLRVLDVHAGSLFRVISGFRTVVNQIFAL
jgi:hypothetical protein